MAQLLTTLAGFPEVRSSDPNPLIAQLPQFVTPAPEAPEPPVASMSTTFMCMHIIEKKSKILKTD